MARLSFSAVTQKAYAHNISEIRTWFQRIASFNKKSVGATADIVSSINSLLAGLQGAVTKAYANGAVVNMNNSTNSKTVAGTLNTAGATPVANLPATAAILTSAQALVVPVTGTYATTATVTIAGGVVTAIVLS